MMARAWAWAWAAALVAVATAEQSRPNVVMIVVDDLGWADVGFRNGDQIRTPEIDAIRQRGLELGRYYTHTACVPSRAALMSGRFSHHHGLHNWLTPASGLGLELDNTLLSERFQSAGYATHMVGKWHLGHHTWDYLPTYRGFNSYLGLINGGGDYFLGRSYDPGHSWFHILEGTAPRCNAESCFRVAQEAQLQYSTEYFTEKAVKIIDRHGSSGRETPLFLFVAYQGVHYGGWQGTQVPQEYVSPYLETLGPGQRRQFAGMLAAVDYGIGNITRALERNGMGGNETLVVITTDNGGPVDTSDAVGSRNTPFRGGKHSLYEGGVRGTCVLAGYGIKRRGTYSGLMHIADWVATLAEMASLSMHSAVPLDSLSHWSQLSAAPEDEVDNGGFSYKSPVRTSVALGNTSDHGNLGFGMLYDAPDGRQWKIIVDSAGFPDGWSELETEAEARELPQLPAAAAAAGGGGGSGERTGGGFGSRPCDGGFCLFELTSDPQERKDLARDPRFARELARYKALLFQELKTFRTAARDCHKAPISKFVEQVGPAWWPYCPSVAGRSEAHDQDLDPWRPTDDSSRQPSTGSRATISVAL